MPVTLLDQCPRSTTFSLLLGFVFCAAERELVKSIETCDAIFLTGFEQATSFIAMPWQYACVAQRIAFSLTVWRRNLNLWKLAYVLMYQRAKQPLKRTPIRGDALPELRVPTSHGVAQLLRTFSAVSVMRIMVYRRGLSWSPHTQGKLPCFFILLIVVLFSFRI